MFFSRNRAWAEDVVLKRSTVLLHVGGFNAPAIIPSHPWWHQRQGPQVQLPWHMMPVPALPGLNCPVSLWPGLNVHKHVHGRAATCPCGCATERKAARVPNTYLALTSAALGQPVQPNNLLSTQASQKHQLTQHVCGPMALSLSAALLSCCPEHQPSMHAVQQHMNA